MTPEQWQQVKVALGDVLELAPARRTAQLESFYAQHPTLRSEIESLLRAHDEVAILGEPPESQSADATCSWIGRRLGAYELAEHIGSGGMGMVFRAVRADGQYEKQVAIKLIHASFGTEYFLARFRNERQILAALEHPNIARLLDGGTTENGLPYVVMEYVQGLPVDDYCDVHQFTTLQRLELFRTVCAAVQYAHEHHVIHRDLKPGNILVTADGVPKLLDFGLAKILGTPGQGLQSGQSVALLQIMTPDFASPEQVRGLASSPASDVYSLGVILYRLLTGHPPYRTDGVLPRDVVRAVCETEPERPSVASTRPHPPGEAAAPPSALRRAVASDLDHIVLKALRKEPASRYASVSELSEDIGRYVRGLPVKARRGTLHYRTTKLLGRHLATVWSVCLLAVGAAVAYGVAVSYAAAATPGLAMRAATIVLLGALLAAAVWSWQSERRSRDGSSKATGVALAAMLLLGAGVIWRFAAGFAPLDSAFNPPPHSVAVMPFANLSGDPKQEYFSDGVSEDLINALSSIRALQVAARTSSFSFKGHDVDTHTIARKLNVAAILEGSVRRAGDRVRISAQLINSANGYRMWQQTYDRDLKDALALQADVATAVAQQLQLKLVGDEAQRIQAGGTHDPRAHDAYLLGMHLYWNSRDEAGYRAALAQFDRAIEFDKDFAAAHANRAFVLAWTSLFTTERTLPLKEALAAADRAVALAPDLGDAHLARGWVCSWRLDFVCADMEYDRAITLAPGDVRVLRGFAVHSSIVGRHEVALAAARSAVALDPQNALTVDHLGENLYAARRYEEAVAAFRESLGLAPSQRARDPTLFMAYFMLHRADAMLQLCEPVAAPLSSTDRHFCLALAYHALGRQGDAEAERRRLQAEAGDALACINAVIYAQWGNARAALDWLGTAERLHDPMLQDANIDPLYDPLRTDPEFKALLQRLNFPARGVRATPPLEGTPSRT